MTRLERDSENKSMLLNEAASAVKWAKIILCIFIGFVLLSILIGFIGAMGSSY